MSTFLKVFEKRNFLSIKIINGSLVLQLQKGMPDSDLYKLCVSKTDVPF